MIKSPCWLIVLLASHLSAGSSLFAADGKMLYDTYCSACHGLQGEGAGDGMFPPLAGSMWVQGRADRIVQIALRGLHGDIRFEVKQGDQSRMLSYNLAMPPQGDMLNDEQVAQIVSYVRSSWENGAEGISADEVAKMRLSTAERKEMWTMSELLEAYPLEQQPTEEVMGGIHQLAYQVYHGPFKSLKELEGAEVVAHGEMEKGLLSVKVSGREDEFGLIWEGEIEVPDRGEYEFGLTSDDGSSLTVAGKEVLVVDRIGPISDLKVAKLPLEKGRVPVRVKYFEFHGEEKLILAWRKVGGDWVWLSEDRQSQRELVSIPLNPSANEAVMYRNFIEGSSARAIGVGYPGGVNLVFSADHLSLDLLWQGNFMDGGLHWVDRGIGWQAPASTQGLVSFGSKFPFLSQENSGDQAEALKPRFLGYELDEKRQPTFSYQVGKAKIQDRFLPQTDGQGMLRELVVDGEISGLSYQVYRGDTGIESLGDGRFLLGGQLEVAAEGSTIEQDGQTLLVPINQSGLRLTYHWR